jgi:hypothetical protein
MGSGRASSSVSISDCLSSWWPQRDAIELAEFKCAISLPAEWDPHGASQEATAEMFLPKLFSLVAVICWSRRFIAGLMGDVEIFWSGLRQPVSISGRTAFCLGRPLARPLAAWPPTGAPRMRVVGSIQPGP